MRSAILAGLAAVGAVAGPLSAQRAVTVPPGLIADIKYLASDSLGGRLTGSPGADSAAAYLARRFAAVGLQAAPGGWFQDFPLAQSVPALGAQHEALSGRNVIGILPGRDPVLRREAVIVGAHYDHLGGGEFGSLDPDSTGKIHNGADDNASGAAALVYIAEALAAAPPARTVVFIAFSGEELGLLGSTWYVKHAIYPLERTEAMINLDMVGRMRNKRLIVYGAATAREFNPLLDSLNWYQGFDLRKQGDGYGPSDQSAFYAAHLPVLHLFTDLHEDYHRTTDDWQKLNFDDLARVVQFAAGIASALGNHRGALTFVEVPTAHATRPGDSAVTSGYGAYLGTIPDMSDSPGGVRLMGVRGGSPADRAGLKAGDVITRIGRYDVPDLQGMTDALRRFQAGDSASIVIRRGDATLTLGAIFGKRD
ncbi:MAG TPA: M20/M25/M40 family metallo-hydrolase [Gemmatimonadales bacterium]|nr:M20/M25/M40 family metallo-hydrolase [Gemmatimonadales bacterium]